MEEFISRIQQINKDELNEREFYEQVLDIIKGMEDVSLTPQSFEQLKKALEEINNAKPILEKYKAKVVDIINYTLPLDEKYERCLIVINFIN